MDIKLAAENLRDGNHIYHSIRALFYGNDSLYSIRKYGIEQLVKRYVRDEDVGEPANDLLGKIEQMKGSGQRQPCAEVPDPPEMGKSTELKLTINDETPKAKLSEEERKKRFIHVFHSPNPTPTLEFFVPETHKNAFKLAPGRARPLPCDEIRKTEKVDVFMPRKKFTVATNHIEETAGKKRFYPVHDAKKTVLHRREVKIEQGAEQFPVNFAHLHGGENVEQPKKSTIAEQIVKRTISEEERKKRFRYTFTPTVKTEPPVIDLRNHKDRVGFRVAQAIRKPVHIAPATIASYSASCLPHGPPDVKMEATSGLSAAEKLHKQIIERSESTSSLKLGRNDGGKAKIQKTPSKSSLKGVTSSKSKREGPISSKFERNQSTSSALLTKKKEKETSEVVTSTSSFRNSEFTMKFKIPKKTTVPKETASKSKSAVEKMKATAAKAEKEEKEMEKKKKTIIEKTSQSKIAEIKKKRKLIETSSESSDSESESESSDSGRKTKKIKKKAKKYSKSKKTRKPSPPKFRNSEDTDSGLCDSTSSISPIQETTGPLRFRGLLAEDSDDDEEEKRQMDSENSEDDKTVVSIIGGKIEPKTSEMPESVSTKLQKYLGLQRNDSLFAELIAEKTQKSAAGAVALGDSQFDLKIARNIIEYDYEAVRPQLIDLSTSELKEVLNRNPRIAKVADGLFRRRCQTDFPAHLSEYQRFGTWRSLHDHYAKSSTAPQ